MTKPWEQLLVSKDLDGAHCRKTDSKARVGRAVLLPSQEAMKSYPFLAVPLLLSHPLPSPLSAEEPPQVFAD